MIRSKKVDALSIALIAVEMLFIIYCVTGLPLIIAKITFLSYSTSQRVLAIMGFIDIILLIRLVSHKRDTKKEAKPLVKSLIIFAGFSAITLIGLVFLHNASYHPPKIVWAMAVAFIIWIIYLIARDDSEHKEKLAITLICIITLTGLAVNPIQQGADVILEDGVTLHIRDIVSNEPESKWIVVGEDAKINNVPIAAGAPTINCTNTYPNLSTWEMLDESGSHSDVYNRYAHILMDITEGDTAFEIKYADQIQINVNRDDLRKLDVSYIYSTKPLDSSVAEYLYNIDSNYIYKVVK